MQDTHNDTLSFTLTHHGKPVGELSVQVAEPVDGLDIPHLCMAAAQAVCPHVEVYRAAAEIYDDMKGDLLDTPLPWALTVRLGGAAEGRDLNREFRHKDYATNVLSFAADDAEPDSDAWYVGDIFICVPVLLQEAAEMDTPVHAHLQHLVVHGMLHLVGYDHELGDAEAAEMEDLERTILADLGLPDPYVAHDKLMKDPN